MVRESGLLVETLERIRQGLPFALRALDVDNGSEFVNDSLIQYCLSHGIELTRSRPYRRFQGIGAAQAISRLAPRVCS